jgi:hypothetical protein
VWILDESIYCGALTAASEKRRRRAENPRGRLNPDIIGPMRIAALVVASRERHSADDGYGSASGEAGTV